MPQYEYECPDCGHRYDEMKDIESRRMSQCPECGCEEVVLLISETGLPQGTETPGPSTYDRGASMSDEEWNSIWED